MDKAEMRLQLAIFRYNNQNWSMKDRLSETPFRDTRKLFGVKKDTPITCCCVLFGRQLVLKIIDELLE